MNKKWIKRGIWIIILAAGAGGLWMFMNRPVEVQTATLTRGPAVTAVYATGIVEPSVEVRIAPRVAGRLVDLNVDEGATVKAGQVLARLEADDLSAAIEEARARANLARQQFARISALVEKGWGTKAQLDAARAEQAATAATVNKLSKQAGYARLVSPSSGTVIKRDGEIGDYIPVNQPVFYLATNSPLRITAAVDEEDMPLVSPGQVVLIRADAFPDEVFKGTVKEVTPRGDASSRSYRVRMALDPTQKLKIGTTVETNIVISTRENALLAPVRALAGTDIWVVRGGKLARMEVKLGTRGDDKVEILGGLKGDETLVMDPDAKLKEGERVIAVPAKADKPMAQPRAVPHP